MGIGFNISDDTDYYGGDKRDSSIKKFNRVRLIKDVERQIASLPYSSRSRKLLIECLKELSK